jgi:hypothetical protein
VKVSNKVQLLLALLLGLVILAWKFHLMPKEFYSIMPVTLKTIKQRCDYRGQRGSCAIFKCGKHVLKTRFSWLKIPPSRGERYLLEGEVSFRNKKEVCAGLDNQDDTYFEVSDMVQIKVDTHE